jgi:hypothetical protein
MPIMNTSNGTGTAISRLPTPDDTDENAVVKFVDDILEVLKKPKRGHEKRWKESILMIAGEHWLEFDQNTSNFQAANYSQWVPRPTTNYLVKLYDRLIDIFTSGDLHANTVPATDDQVDIDSADTSEHLLNNLQEQIKTSEIFHPLAATWLIATGNVILHAAYDTNAGEIVKAPQHEVIKDPFIGEDGKQVLDAEGSPVWEVSRRQKKGMDGRLLFDERKDGQVSERVVPTLSWYPEITDLPSNVTYGIEVQVMSLDQLRNTFGEEVVGDTDKDPGVAGEDVSEFSVGNFLDNKLLKPLHDNAEDEHVLLKIYRSEPTARWEDGKVIMTAGGKLLHIGPLEKYYEGKLPYRHIRYRELPGEFWGIGPLDAALPLIKRLNAIDSNIVHHRKTMLNPQIFEPKGANIGETTGKMGARIVWDWRLSGGHAPTVKPSSPMSPEITKERAQVLVDIEQIVGTVEVLSGQQPSGVSTIGQTQILAEQGLRRFAPIVRRWRSGLGNHEQRKLLIIREMYNTPRLVKIIGENEALEIRYFTGADIGNTQDVYIKEESGIVFSETFQQQTVERAVELGLLDTSNPAITAKIMDIMKIPGFVNQFSLDAKLARRNLQKIRDGAPVGNPMAQEGNPPGVVMARNNDNHFIHLQVYSDFTKTTEFEAETPEIQANVGQIMTQYLTQVQQQQQQAVANVQNTRGSGKTSEQAVNDSGAIPSGAQTQQLTAV